MKSGGVGTKVKGVGHIAEVVCRREDSNLLYTVLRLLLICLRDNGDLKDIGLRGRFA